MTTFYKVVFHSGGGSGSMAMCMGNGFIVGLSATGISFKGSYEQRDGNVVGTASFTTNGDALVTGAILPAGTTVEITFDLPVAFADGAPVQMLVIDKPVTMIFERIGDIPGQPAL